VSTPVITGEFVLPSDVVLAPVESLPSGVRDQLAAEEGEFVVTRTGVRAPSRIVDAQAADLLEGFRSPSTIVDAVIDYSRTHSADPEETLEGAYPMLERLIGSGVLVSAGSDAAEPIAASLRPGERFGGWEVVAPIQVIEDTELYQVRDETGDTAALKLFQAEAPAGLRRLVAKEVALLERLGGEVAPRLLAADRDGRRPYLLLEWVPGVAAPVVAAELRGTLGGRSDLIELCRSIASAYARLHALGVVHSDVHPNNVLVGADGSVRLLDFGVARVVGADDPLVAAAPRAGVAFYFEPEYADALRYGRTPPSSTMLGEQYAVAALLYLLVTGAHYLDFSLEQGELLRQIAQDPPLPFSARRVEPWPELEALLATCLRKDPRQRLPDMKTLANRLRELGRSSDEARATERPVDVTRATRLLERVLERVGRDGPFFAGDLPTAPTCSVNYGAAGIGYALYRLSCLRADPELLALADLWSTRALAHEGDENAWCSPELDITPERIGPISTFHTAAGAYCVAALIRHAQGDAGGRADAVRRFVAASTVPAAGLDLTLGRASAVQSCAMLLEAAGSGAAEVTILRELGDQILAGVWQELDGFAPIPECEELRYLGIAHGWAGILYATLRWSDATGAAEPSAAAVRLDELAQLAEPAGRGLRWKVTTARDVGAGQYMSGWCNGSAGMVHLWTLAHRRTGDERYLRLAERAAWNAWETDEAVNQVCCGRAGKAYAFLNLFRHTHDASWLRRARVLADRAAGQLGPAETEGREDSLYKGRTGVALLAADQAAPEAACQPFFEPEGWPVG
jgi:eukaryotic-like serine/threonine-protein kinase